MFNPRCGHRGQQVKIVFNRDASEYLVKRHPGNSLDRPKHVVQLGVRIEHVAHELAGDRDRKSGLSHANGISLVGERYQVPQSALEYIKWVKHSYGHA